MDPDLLDAEHQNSEGCRSEYEQSQRHALILQSRQQFCVDMVELAADVVDRDAHHEDADENVEQNAQLDRERDLLDQGLAENEDAVLQHQIANDLGDRLAPDDEDQEADQECRKRNRDQKRRRRGPWKNQHIGQPERDSDEDCRNQHRQVQADEGLGLTADVGLADRPKEKEGNEQSLDDQGANAQQSDVNDLSAERVAP